MPATTPVYGIPYPQELDEPNGPEQLEALAFLLEGEIQRVDTEAALTSGSVSSLSAAFTSHAGSTSAHGVSGNIVGTTGAQELFGKTINGANNTLTVLKNQVQGAPTGAFVGTSDGQTLTGKVMSGLNNSFSNIPQSAVLLGLETSTAIAPNGGWSISSGVAIARKYISRIVYIELRLERTGSDIIGDENGNMSAGNRIVAQIPVGYRPIQQIAHHWTSNQTDGGGYIQNDGQIVISSMNPGSQIATGHIVYFTTTYVI